MLRNAIMIAGALSVAAVAMTRSDTDPPPQSSLLSVQTRQQADAKSRSCLGCHHGIEPMHASSAVKLGCTDCHGGNAAATTKQEAHVQPRVPSLWSRNGVYSSANPERSYARLNDESA